MSHIKYSFYFESFIWFWLISIYLFTIDKDKKTVWCDIGIKFTILLFVFYLHVLFLKNLTNFVFSIHQLIALTVFVARRMQCVNAEYETANVIVFSSVVALQREKEGLTADYVLSQCWKLACLSRCLYITSTQQQRESFFFFSLLSYPRAAALAVDG
jgi:hypothetical protein